MPVFSLPDGPGIGDLGPGAYRFVDFLQDAGQTIWQLLPLGPTAQGNSPYSSYSVFAGNPLLISCELLVEDGLLTTDQLQQAGYDCTGTDIVDYDKAAAIKRPLVRTAFDGFHSERHEQLISEFETYCRKNRHWLDDFAVFKALAGESGSFDWTTWDSSLVHRDTAATTQAQHRLKRQIQLTKFEQFVFARQWQQLKSYANERNVRLYGDMPIFVALESVDVWINQDLFLLGNDGHPLFVAGVPPDYFSKTGQKWGNPLYRWPAHDSTNFAWWTERFRQALASFDLLRIDHFRGFESYWEVPDAAENAISGIWQSGPRHAPFVAAQQALGDLPIIAEDLGLITDEVHALRDELGFPGMRVLQFGMDHEHDTYHRPEAYPEHSVAYTGTHDNDTLVGWYKDRCDRGINNTIVDRFLGAARDQIHVDLIRAVLQSAADTAIIPIQDLLGFGSEARTNIPGNAAGNWRWRCPEHVLTPEIGRQLQQMTVDSSRTSQDR